MALLEPGANCWRVADADRVAFLIDYQAYFAALRAALAAAERQILLLGWSFDPRTRLTPDGGGEAAAPDRIGKLLIDLAAEKPSLDIRVLIWRSTLAISATQAFFPARAAAWFKGTGVHFRLDGATPFGACHHQKIIVADDQIAFVSSGDLCGDRWDSPAHLDRDSRRRSPGGGFHPPRHEASVMASGAVAEALGDLCRARWREAGGGELDAPGRTAAFWPEGLRADLSATSVAIARTMPAWRGLAGVEEIAALTLAAIASARRCIYVENQYFTSPPVAEALAARLAEPDGPEVVLISTWRSASYFDRLTMDRTRSVFIWRLRAADIFGRLRVLAPFTVGGRPIIVHAKIMIIDDTLVRVGSANLNNRSQGFDTECEAAVEARDANERAAIQALGDSVAGHWLDRAADAVAASRARRGGLIGAIDEVNRNGRLRPIEPHRLGPIADFIANVHLGDPMNPGDAWTARRRRERLYRQARSVMGRKGPFRSRNRR